MKYLLTILLLIGSVFAQNTTYKDGTECKCDSIHQEYYVIDSLEGTDNNTWLWIETPYRNNKTNGIEKRYYRTGELYSKSSYVNDVCHGIVIYYTTGNIDTRIPYKNGVIDGIEKMYYESGTLNYETTYNSGKKVDQKAYYESGSLMFNIKYKNDLANGSFNEYFENGKLAGTATYNNGELVGYKKCTDGRFGNESLNCLK